MLECQRHAYLSALGIDSYVPRRQLVGALPPHLLVISEGEAVSASIQPIDHASDLPQDVAPAAIPFEVELPQAPVATSTACAYSPEPQASVPRNEDNIDTVVSAQSQPIRFTLKAWKVQHDILVLDSHDAGAALPTDRLLQNILRVMGYPLAQLPTSDVLRWPLFNHSFGPSDTHEADEARAMVQAYIAAQHSQYPLRLLLLMGQTAHDYALLDTSPSPDGQMFTHRQGAVFTDQTWQIMTAVTPSLSTLLQEPMQKALAWQALQGFLSQASH